MSLREQSRVNHIVITYQAHTNHVAIPLVSGVVTPGATRRIIDADVAEPKQLLPYGNAPALPRLVAVAAGEHFTAALSEAGDVFTWGKAVNGRLGRSPAHQVQCQP